MHLIKNYRSDIDGLRALAIISTVLFHAFPGYFPGGFIGVDIFFVISGYLITGIIYHSLEKGTFSFFDFYSRRIRRLYPAILLLLTALLIAGAVNMTAPELTELSIESFFSTLFSTNLYLFFGSDYFAIDSRLMPLLHFWSLGVEEQFYLIIPFICFWVYKKKYDVLKVLIALFFLSLLANLILIGAYPKFTFYIPFTRFWEIFAGGILCLLQRRGLHFKNYKPILIETMTWILFLIYVYCFIKYDKEGFPGVKAIVPVIICVFYLANSNTFFSKKVLSNPLMVYVGLVSYPFYLWHWSMLSFLRMVENDSPSGVQKVIAVLISFGFAMMTYHLVEIPLKKKSNELAKCSKEFNFSFVGTVDVDFGNIVCGLSQ
jgi:peptidoglycan/LPS O-acetylase OafA/YrhL